MADKTASDNQVFGKAPQLDLNHGNTASGEIVIGEMVRSPAGVSLAYADPSQYNSVAVRVLRTAERNGDLTLFSGRVLGTNIFEAKAYAQAAFI